MKKVGVILLVLILLSILFVGFCAYRKNKTGKCFFKKKCACRKPVKLDDPEETPFLGELIEEEIVITEDSIDSEITEETEEENEEIVIDENAGEVVANVE